MNEENKEKETKDLVPIQDEIDIFKKFDEMDDSLVLAEVEKKAVDVWVYHFKQSGHDIWGLSKEGIDQCAIHLGKTGIALREDDVTYQLDPTSPEHVIFTAKVSKHLVDDQGHEAGVETAIGVKRQSTMRKIKMNDPPYYNMVANDFWAEQGAMKAIRNAKMRLIPEEIKSRVIANAKKSKGKVKSFQGETQQEQKKKEKPKPANSDLTNPEVSPFDKKSDLPNNNAHIPDETPETETLQLRPASKHQQNKVTSMQQTMTDKYGFVPVEVLEKMDEKAGSHNIIDYSDIQAEKVIEYFQWVFDEMDGKHK